MKQYLQNNLYTDAILKFNGFFFKFMDLQYIYLFNEPYVIYLFNGPYLIYLFNGPYIVQSVIVLQANFDDISDCLDHYCFLEECF